MAAKLTEIKIGPEPSANWIDRVPWLYPTMLLVIFFSFFRLGQAPLDSWDEAHIGINAMEMLQNGDWLNRSLGGEADYMKTEPPLVVWMVATNFSLFGPSAFSLRLHSAIATLFIFFFLFRIVQLYRPPLFAFGVCLILLSVQGIIGFQVSQAGDVDATFMAFLLGGLYFFLRYLDFMRYQAIYIAAILWGLAFWTKGPTFVIIFPGLLLYLGLNGRLRHVLRLREFYKALGIVVLFPIIWYATSYLFGQTFDESTIKGSKAFEQISRYQTFNPFTDGDYDGSTLGTDLLFIWEVLQRNFRHWDIVFYGVLLFGLVRKKIKGLPKWEPHQYRLSLLAFCIWLPLGIYFSFAPDVKYQYFTPAIPFIAITTFTGIWWLSKRYFRITALLFCLFWLFCMYSKYFGYDSKYFRYQPYDAKTELIDNQSEWLIQSNSIYQLGRLPAKSVLLNLYFKNSNIVFGDVDDVLAINSPKLTVFVAKEQALFMTQEKRGEWQKYLANFTIIDEDEHYLILEKN